MPTLALAAANVSTAAPPPPLPAEEEVLLKTFFQALPDQIPEQIERFAPFVSPDVKVYRQGTLAFSTRDAWFAYLRSFAATEQGGPRGISVSRESFYRTADGGVAALEFSYPLPPVGMEGQITYHPDNPLQLVTYYLRGGRLIRVDYGQPMRSYDYLLRDPAGGQPQVPTAATCPAQPEPAPLASAGFNVPSQGATLLFSAAPSFQSVRYALRLVERPGTAEVSASLVRLQRRSDCNVHDRAGNWDFELTKAQARPIFEAAEKLERTDLRTADVVVDGSTVELQRFANGNKLFSYEANGLEKEQLSRVVLQMLKQHVPLRELPTDPTWSYKLPGSSL